MKRYCSIENSYRNKFIDAFLHVCPALENEIYIIQEKIDGTNIRIHITKDDIQIGSRNQVLTVKDHQGIKALLKEVPIYMEKFKLIQSELEDDNSVTLHGELFGRGINKRVPYWEKIDNELRKKLLFFDMRTNDEMAPPFIFYFHMEQWDMLDLVVKVNDVFGSLEDALKTEKVFKSSYADHDAEGVVIKPFYNTYYNPLDNIFYLKHKNPAFGKSKEVKMPKLPKTPNLFLAYINENRVIDMFSKIGPIESKSQMGKYIKLIIKDALDDWMKDYEDPPIKQHMSAAGRVIAGYLLKSM